jgi:hypothetical protein
MTSDGIKYSNIEPDQEISAAPLSTGVTARPSRNQCRAGMSPLAMPGTTHEVARLVGALFSEKIGFLTGETIYIDGGQGANI